MSNLIVYLDLWKFWFRVSNSSLSETHAKSDGLTSINPKFSLSSMEFFRDAKIESIGGNKPPNVRSPKKIPDLSILKISK